jgi:NADH-quinone oxidoreductase subunit N
MSAPIIWIVFPAVAAALMLLLLREERATAIIGCVLCACLALLAWGLSIDTAYAIGATSFKISPSLDILGRRLSLTMADQPLLVLIYTSTAAWFLGSVFINLARRLVPLGLAITSVLVASLAVEPFLYAALLIEMAVLLSIPMLITQGQPPGRGVLRFLIFQTLAMPFILFSGWLLAGIEANPGNLALVQSAGILLGLGFAFLLAIFPFYTWFPLLVEDVPPFIAGFILWTFPTAALLFLTTFLDRYSWMRTSSAMITILVAAGILMIAIGGILAAFQRYLGRILAYGMLVETGFSLLALGLNSFSGVSLFFALFLPRLLSLTTWSFALTIIQKKSIFLKFSEVKGLGRIYPLASIGVGLANLSLVGLPILAGFPIRQALVETIAQQFPSLILWIFLGSMGLTVSAMRTLAVLFMTPAGTPWERNETGQQSVLLFIEWGLLVLLGLFPQWVVLITDRIPVMFQHLGQ